MNFFKFMFWAMILWCTSVSGTYAHSEVEFSKICVGVTLHPYYSFVKNIVQDRAEVVSLIGSRFNPHNYQPQPEDIKRLVDEETRPQVIVVNGIGHDEFVFRIIAAARLNEKIPLIYANEGVSLVPVCGTSSNEKIVNSHTFIGINSASQQIYNIARRLGEVDPQNAAFYRKNARNYVRRLRKLKAKYMQRLSGLSGIDFRCATFHGGYDYLLQEFGLQVVAVIEPKHGVKPSAVELADTIQKIKQSEVSVLFSEMDFPDNVVETIKT